MNIIVVVAGLFVLGIALSQRRSPVMTPAMFLSGVAIGAACVCSGVLGVF